jgi:hypothetical protein
LAVNDHGIEVLKKSGEEVTPGDKSDYYIKVGPTPGHPIEFQLAEPDTPTVYNLTSPIVADTEFSQVLSGTVRKLMIQCRDLADTKLAFTSGGAFVTIPSGGCYSEDSVKLVGATIYLKTSLGSKTVEVLTWS